MSNSYRWFICSPVFSLVWGSPCLLPLRSTQPATGPQTCLVPADWEAGKVQTSHVSSWAAVRGGEGGVCGYVTRVVFTVTSHRGIWDVETDPRRISHREKQRGYKHWEWPKSPLCTSLICFWMDEHVCQCLCLHCILVCLLFRTVWKVKGHLLWSCCQMSKAPCGLGPHVQLGLQPAWNLVCVVWYTIQYISVYYFWSRTK